MAKRKITVALNFPRTPGQAIFYAKHIAAMMDGNPYFPSPSVPMSTLLAHIAELEAAEVATKTGVHGAAAARDAKLDDVHNDLKQLRTYIETIANQHAEDAEAVVASSGMSLKQSAGPSKADFAVQQGKVSGSVRLRVRHPGTVTSVDWQTSSDGEHWVDAPRTVRANADIEGLTPGTRYWFRYRTLTSAGTSDWSDALTLLVV
jgi:hypothetical protein